MRAIKGSSLRHLLLIVFLIIIYLIIAFTFLATYSLSKPFGTIPAVAISSIVGLATLSLGARGFWQLVIKLSKR